MKKRKHILGLLVIVLFVFSSCQFTNLPSSSATFSRSFVKDFFNDYELVDMQLAYRTASPCEVEILRVPSGGRFDSVLLSQISNTSVLDFVAVTELRSYYLMGGAPHNSTWVYKKADAPNPMADWTVSRVDVLEYSDRDYQYRSVMSSDGISWHVEDLGQKHISAATVICSFTSSDSGFFEMVKESYESAKGASEWLGNHFFKEVIKKTASYSPDKSEPGDRLFYSLLVCFEESEELVWESQLYIYDEVLYFACFSYDSQNSKNITERFARLDDAMAQIIIECLGLETEDSNSNSPLESDLSRS